jgi:hypothetical protein
VLMLDALMLDIDFDGAIVLFDGLAIVIVTRTEVSISLEHEGVPV